MEEILKSIEVLNGTVLNSIDVQGLALDSRKVKNGYLFFAYKGLKTDGHEYIASAVNNGASIIVLDNPDFLDQHECSYVLVKDARRTVSKIASAFYDNPSGKLTVTGITGTNGKTTVASLLSDVFTDLGFKCGLISTIRIKYQDKEIPAQLTTPDPLSLQEVFHEMYEAGVTHVFMEVSSHAIEQGRTSNIDFDLAVFTNLSRDHLDYHETFAEYLKAKQGLFDGMKASAHVLTNIDDRNGMIMVQNSKANIHTYALKRPADFKGKVISNELTGLHLSFEEKEVYLKLVGYFNGYNALAVYAAGVLLGQDPEDILRALSNHDSAEGRMDIVRNPESGITGIVDYAHTPDALQKVLETLVVTKNKNARIITVLGCGGNRDKGKRPQMASIAGKFSGTVILTSDNPRDEDPEVILDEMFEGVIEEKRNIVFRITNRKEAIKMACNLARRGDVILVAGKGHENYQEIKGQRFPFNDKKILSAFMH
ncbi:MAG: UDP-N-acetylmuramoyl-L-alanyl-D-glutamate--2,6-diaminopimelate ligase [Saprospiraceae bacterium]|nr:UDP-N-acetylmuramoyl-L-alanyl-D-glutamate--2,6-diaminopimelate ligase [Saprospiraceae bacterium]